MSPGTIFTNQSISSSSAESVVQLVVVAYDGGSPSLSTNVAVQVQITDVNNFSPQFLQSSYRSAPLSLLLLLSVVVVVFGLNFKIKIL